MVAVVTLLCVTLSILTINAASLQIHQLDTSHELAKGQVDHPAVPRKLMFNNKIDQGYDAKDLVSSNGPKKESGGESHKEEEEEEQQVKVIMHAAKGTRQEWIEGSDPTHEYFTMDYSHVRRRRPIHNKSFHH